MTKPKINTQDHELREKSEHGVLGPILMADALAGSRLIGTLLDTLRPPLAKWFKGPANRTLAVALDAHLRGEIDCDQASVAGYLSGLPHEALHQILTGKKVTDWKLCDYEGSALQSAGGYSGAFPPDGHYPASAALGWAKILRGLYEQEQAIDILRKTAVEVSRANPANGISEIIAEAAEQIAAITSNQAQGKTSGHGLEQVVEDAKRAAQRRVDGEGSPCSWGIPELDAFAPLRPGALIILSAPPGAGKTSLALMAAAATAEAGGRGSVAMASLEMSQAELVTILCARELKISPSAIRDWRPAAAVRESEIKQIAERWKQSDGLAVRDATAGSKQTGSAIVSWFRQRKATSKDKLALGVLDYIGLLESEGKEQEREKLSAASGALKAAAQSLEIPILCLAQLNREGRKAVRDVKTGKAVATPEPRKEDLAGSGALEANADMIVFVHFPEASTEIANPRGKIIVAKQRGGATGSIDVIFHRSHQLFTFDPPIKNKSMSQNPHESEDAYAQP